jgi:hypothetical protein
VRAATSTQTPSASCGPRDLAARRCLPRRGPRWIQAKAFTTGNNIFFRDGLPDASSASGQSLLAHELTHTIQQGGAQAQRQDDVARADTTQIQRQATIEERLAQLANNGMADPAAQQAQQAVGTPEWQAQQAEKSTKAKAGWATIGAAVDKSRDFNDGLGHSSAGESGASKKTVSAGGAWLANHVGNKEKIGSVDEYMGRKDDPTSKHSKHLEQFLDGAHAFITPWVHTQIFNLNEDGSGWGGWGQDFNFVAPLGVADALVEKAAAPGAGGIWDLESELGIPPGQWVKGCAPTYSIYRYKVHDPKKLRIVIPSGNETNAYGSWWKKDDYQAGQWEPKGHTEGGAAEAVVKKLSIAELKKLGTDVLEIVEEKRLAENTMRVIQERSRAKQD